MTDKQETIFDLRMPYVDCKLQLDEDEHTICNLQFAISKEK
jgi:hypothetical protein